MRGTVARELRRQAYPIAEYIAPELKYLSRTKDGVTPARFGRRVYEASGKVQDYTPRNNNTVRLHPRSVRAVYRRLKRLYKAGLLN